MSLRRRQHRYTNRDQITINNKHIENTIVQDTPFFVRRWKKPTRLTNHWRKKPNNVLVLQWLRVGRVLQDSLLALASRILPVWKYLRLRLYQHLHLSWNYIPEVSCGFTTLGVLRLRQNIKQFQEISFYILTAKYQQFQEIFYIVTAKYQQFQEIFYILTAKYQQFQEILFDILTVKYQQFQEIFSYISFLHTQFQSVVEPPGARNDCLCRSEGIWNANCRVLRDRYSSQGGDGIADKTTGGGTSSSSECGSVVVATSRHVTSFVGPSGLAENPLRITFVSTQRGRSSASGVYVNVRFVGKMTPSLRTRLTGTWVGWRVNFHPHSKAEMSGTRHSKLSPHLREWGGIKLTEYPAY